MTATLGSLTADDLGLTITFADGGATYTGTLKSVQHEPTLSGGLKTFVVIYAADNWRHMKTYSSDTPCAASR